jgi:hypothetical protein
VVSCDRGDAKMLFSKTEFPVGAGADGVVIR